MKNRILHNGGYVLARSTKVLPKDPRRLGLLHISLIAALLQGFPSTERSFVWSCCMVSGACRGRLFRAGRYTPQQPIIVWKWPMIMSQFALRASLHRREDELFCSTHSHLRSVVRYGVTECCVYNAARRMSPGDRQGSWLIRKHRRKLLLHMIL